MMDNQEYTFLLWAKEIEMRYVDMPKDQRIKVERWLDKLVVIDTNYLFMKERNMYAKLLLDMVFAKKLMFPFHTSPPEGSLPRFPSHLRHSLKNTVGVHETQYWRELYKRIIATNNPALEESYERSLERIGELEAELFDLKSKSELQEMKIEDLISANLSLEKVRVELSESLRINNAEISDLLSKLTAEEECVQHLEEELSEYKLNLLDLADKVDSETEMNETLTQHIDDDRKQLEEIGELLSSEVAENKTLQEALTASQVAQQDLDHKINALQSTITELEAKMKEREGRLESMQEVISSQKDASTMLHTLLEESRLQEKRVAAELAAVQAEQTQRQHDFIKCQEEFHGEQATVKHLEEQLQSCRADFKQQIDELKQVVAECKQDKEECRQDLRNRASELTAAVQDREEVEKLNKELERTVQESTKIISDAVHSESLVREELANCKHELSVNVLLLTQKLQERDSEIEKLRETEKEKYLTLERRLEETASCSSDIHEKLTQKIVSLQDTLQQRDREIELVMEHASDVGKMLLESEDMREQLSSELDSTRIGLASCQQQLDSLHKSMMNEREKREILDSHMHLLQHDTDRASIQKSAEVISRFKLQRSLTECTDRNAEVEQQLRSQLRINEGLKQQLESSGDTTRSLTLRLSEMQQLVEQRGRVIKELEAKLAHVEAARSESLNSCLTLAKENHLIERRYETLYEVYKELESSSESMRQSLRVLEEARLKSVHNLEDLIENAFQDMMDGASSVTIKRLK